MSSTTLQSPLALSTFVVAMYACTVTNAQSTQAYFGATSSAVSVTSSAVLLSTVVPYSDGSHTLFLCADGTVTPVGNGGAAELVIETSKDGINWSESSNRSRTGWIDAGQVTQLPCTHSFNCIGIAEVSEASGLYVRLTGRQLASGFTFSVNAFSSLLVMPRQDGSYVSATVATDTGNLASGLSVNQWSWPVGSSSLSPQSNPIIQAALPNNGDTANIVTFASGTAQRMTQSGDCMLNIWFDGEALRTHQGNWSVNDMWPYAEISAPVCNHGLIQDVTLQGQTIEWRGSKAYWGPSASNNITYKVLSSATIVALFGSQIVGRAYRPNIQITNETHTATQEQFISSLGRPGYVPPGTPDLVSRYPVGSTTFTVPQGHSGIFCFTGRCRFQPRINTSPTPPDYGDIFIYLTVDPLSVPLGTTQRGSVGSQQIATSNGLGSESQRTMSCSYLSVGSQVLAPGTYHAALFIVGSPFTPNSFYGAGYYWDTSLVFFD